MKGSPAPTANSLPTLPASWSWAQVQELTAAEERALTDGPFGSNLKTEHYTDDGPRVIRLQNIGDGEFLDARAHISRERFELLRQHEARAGDIVLASLGNDLPRACVVPNALGEAIVKADCPRLRPHSALNPHFLAAMLNSEVVRAQARAVVHGIGRPRLKLAELKKLYVPIAPRQAQDHIVAVLDELMEAVRTGGQSFQRALKGLETYHESLLHELLNGHPCLPLGQVAAIASGITKGRKTKHPTRPRPFMRAANLGDGKLDLGEVKTIDATDDEVVRYRLQAGDVLMVEGSGSPARLGQGWLWEGQVDDCLHQNHVFRARPDRNIVSPRYLAWALQAPLARATFLSFAKTTSGLSTINKAQVSSVPVPLPSLDEQERIVEQLDASELGVNQLRETIERQLLATDALRTALRTSAALGRLNGLRLEPAQTADTILAGIRDDHREHQRARKNGRAVAVGV